ncbi:MAG TPA: TfoX/Sxy family protein [Xanthomonadaceae bacterium]
MRTDEAFIAHLHELLDPLGRVAARAMFGGWGLYLDGIIVGIVDEGRLYLKTDAESQPEFAAAGSAPFVYMSKEGPMAMSYWSVPDEALDATEAMAPWARLALAAALRKQAAKPVRKAKAARTAPTARPAKARKAVAKKATSKVVAGKKTMAGSMTAKADRTANRRKLR